ncbi:hypothetical protein BDN72DRAFT_966038 [Pluteus cervinus]|uniref:Uncharacterized protein n=1 Tax=Pluteus cervinus TaxID=181527 RepID=A0ACD3A1J0_9AGAR|nr:hypothetical protein BDN72DRAFT_966038 [Pluteus cervinus]
MAGYPIFPLEIEYIIFTTALQLRLEDNDRVDLILVAKRVHEWLISKIYQTMAVQTTPPYLKYPNRLTINNLRKYGHHTQNLLVSLDSTVWIPGDRYLSFCPNTTNLVLQTRNHPNRTYLERISCLPLTHLSIDMIYPPSSTPGLFPLFSRITHLRVFHSLSSDNTTRFTSLTHLAIFSTNNEMIHTSILENHPKLEVLVLLEWGLVVEVTGIFDAEVDDPRIVRITYRNELLVGDWLLDVKEGRGMWGLSDEEVRKRKKLKEALWRVPQ